MCGETSDMAVKVIGLTYFDPSLLAYCACIASLSRVHHAGPRFRKFDLASWSLELSIEVED